MEKKAEKQNDYILTPEELDPQAPQDSLPVLVPEANQDPVQSSSLQSYSKPVEKKESPPADIDPPILPNKNSLAHKIFKHYRKLLPILALIVIVVVWSPVKQALQWYAAAPRPGNFNAVVFVPGLLSGWLGDPDMAYATQVAPVMMTSDYERQDGSKRTALRNCTLKIAERFLLGPGDPQKPLTRLADSITLSTAGHPTEAARVIAPIMDTVENPMIKAYNAILYAINGNMKTALAEVDKGMLLVHAGKGMSRSTDTYTLLWAKSQFLQAIGEPRKALECLSSVDAENVKGVTGQSTLAYCKAAAYLQLGEPDLAIKFCRSNDDYDHMILSSAYLMKDDYDKALSEANKIKVDQKDYTVVDKPVDVENCRKALAMSRIFSKKRSFGEALIYAKNAEKLEPNIVNLEQLVYVLNSLGRYREAVNVSHDVSENFFLQCISSGVFECLPELYAGRAEAYTHLGEIDKAFSLVNKALKMNPHCRPALEAGLLAATSQGDAAKVLSYRQQISQLPLVPSSR